MIIFYSVFQLRQQPNIRSPLPCPFIIHQSTARSSLGFDADYPYDTDVCDAFIEQECDDFYASVDGLTGGAPPGERGSRGYMNDPWA